MEAAALEDIAARLFDAFVAHDLDTVAAMLAPDVVIVQNGAQMDWAQARPVIEASLELLPDHRYAQVRRVTGDHAIIEEHHVVSTRPDGRPLTLIACVVLRVDTTGLITRIDEYVDTAPLTTP